MFLIIFDLHATNRLVQARMLTPAAASTAVMAVLHDGRILARCSRYSHTLAPLKFGKPLLNNDPIIDHVQLQQRSDSWEFWVICQY